MYSINVYTADRKKDKMICIHLFKGKFIFDCILL